MVLHGCDPFLQDMFILEHDVVYSAVVVGVLAFRIDLIVQPIGKTCWSLICLPMCL
jgi:hypothetical protein